MLQIDPRKVCYLIVKAREFDAYDAAWTFPIEGDPSQKWYSTNAAKGSNHVGLKDPEVDRLIDTIQVTLDPQERRALFSKLQRRIYELQPYNFGVIAPFKFAMSQKIRGVQLFKVRPGYSIRRWWRAE